MACGDYTLYADYWGNAQFMDAIICPYADVLSMGLFALMVCGAIASGFYARDNSIGIPLVLGFLFGGILIVELPSVFIQAFYTVLIIIIAILAMLVTNRVRGDGGF